MPDTAKSYGIDPLDPMRSAEGAGRMMGDLMKRYDGDLNIGACWLQFGAAVILRKRALNMPEETGDYMSRCCWKITSNLHKAIPPLLRMPRLIIRNLPQAEPVGLFCSVELPERYCC